MALRLQITGTDCPEAFTAQCAFLPRLSWAMALLLHSLPPHDFSVLTSDRGVMVLIDCRAMRGNHALLM